LKACLPRYKLPLLRYGLASYVINVARQRSPAKARPHPRIGLTYSRTSKPAEEDLRSVCKSPEYKTLALSGRVWEDYYQPGDSERYGYTKLELSESTQINDSLRSTLFKEVDLASTSIGDLSQIKLPDVHALLPHTDRSQVAELRNHIVASHWVTEAASQNLDTNRLGEDEIRLLSALIIKGTDSEAIYASSWGERVIPGDYRQSPIGVRGNPLRVFPLPC
jgi:hypothetical protein